MWRLQVFLDIKKSFEPLAGPLPDGAEIPATSLGELFQSLGYINEAGVVVSYISLLAAYFYGKVIVISKPVTEPSRTASCS